MKSFVECSLTWRDDADGIKETNKRRSYFDHELPTAFSVGTVMWECLDIEPRPILSLAYAVVNGKNRPNDPIEAAFIEAANAVIDFWENHDNTLKG